MSVNVISIINMKGGVGKTTITVNLAFYLAGYSKKNVLVVDFDPQSNSTEGLLTYEQYANHKKSKKVISDIFSDIDRIISPVDKIDEDILTLDNMLYNVYSFRDGGKVDLIPAELELTNVLERAGGYNIEDRLKLILKDKKNAYDYVLIDCSPTYSVLTTNALRASDFVLIPVKPDPFSTKGIPLLLKKIDLHNRINKEEDKVKILGIVFSMVKTRLQYVESIKAEVLREHKNVFRNEILYTEHYSKALMENKTIFTSKAGQYFKDNFKKFGQEFESRLIK